MPNNAYKKIGEIVVKVSALKSLTDQFHLQTQSLEHKLRNVSDE